MRELLEFDLKLRDEGFVVDSALEKGRDMPDWYVDPPARDRFDEFFLQAFWDLDTTRPVGMGPGRIPWSAAMDYAERHGLEPDVTELFWVCVKEMDRVYLKYLADNAETSRE